MATNASRASTTAEGTPSGSVRRPPVVGGSSSCPSLRSPEMSQKRYLLTPGPTPVPPGGPRRLAEPVIHHRSPDFKDVFSEALERLQQVFRTENDVLVFTSSGTGAFESAVVEPPLARRPRRSSSRTGEFGERWQKLGAAYGCRGRRRSTYAWGEAPRGGGCRARARRDGGAKVASARPLRDVDRRRLRHPVARRRLQRRRRDLGRRRDLEPRRRAARDRRLGHRRRRHRLAEGADDAARASRSPRSRSARWARSQEATLPRFYWDWANAAQGQAKGSTPFTPADLASSWR